MRGMLSNEQKQILYGAILGDSHVVTPYVTGRYGLAVGSPRGKARVRFEHGALTP
jgi:hypothetical protein